MTVLYAFGLVIANVYLYQIGVSDFSVLRTRFILTGSLAALFVMIFAIFILAVIVACYTVLANINAAKQQGTWKSRDAALAFLDALLLVNGLVLAAAVTVNSNVQFRSAIVDNIVSSIDVILMVFGVLFVIVSSAASFGRRGKHPGYRPNLALLASTMVGLVTGPFFLVVLFVDAFAGTIYPIVPDQFGGAKPKEVVLVLSQEARYFASALGFGPDTSEPMTRRVDLIWETEQGYVVRDLAIPDAPVIQIAREAVSAVIFAAAAPEPSLEPTSPPASPIQ